MKTKLFILKPDNTFYIVRKKKIKDNIIDVKDAKYIIEPNSVFYKLKKGIFDKQYRALFYSEKQINPVKSDGKEVIQVNYLTNTTNERDYIYQDLIHSTAVKDVIGVVKDNLMLALVGAGFGLLLGIIIGLAIGHVKL